MVECDISKYESGGCYMCAVIKNKQFSDANLHFLERRVIDGNVNAAIDLARIAWEQFPHTRESPDAKLMLESLMENLQEKMNVQVLTPFGNTMAAMTVIMDRLEDLAKTNPTLIEQGFNRTLEGFKTEMNNIRTAINEPAAKISELNQLVNQLVYKPIAKGNAGEAVLTDLWIEHFTKDQIEKLGGSGREDILVRPYLGDNGITQYGDAISVERKTGKQKYSGTHRHEAIHHARERGASVALLIYDNPDNLPQSIRPVSISREQGILVIVSDMQSGSWKMMRETTAIIMQTLQNTGGDIAAIDVAAVQEVATELGNLMKLVEQIKGSNSKIKNCADEVEQSIVTIKGLVSSYQSRLQAAVLNRDKTVLRN